MVVVQPFAGRNHRHPLQVRRLVIKVAVADLVADAVDHRIQQDVEAGDAEQRANEEKRRVHHVRYGNSTDGG